MSFAFRTSLLLDRRLLQGIYVEPIMPSPGSQAANFQSPATRVSLTLMAAIAPGLIRSPASEVDEKKKLFDESLCSIRSDIRGPLRGIGVVAARCPDLVWPVQGDLDPLILLAGAAA
jgi:hypothetical protein